MQINGYTIANEEKMHRVIYGTVGKLGQAEGGIGEDASDEAKLAAYDKLAGLILQGKNKVKTGSFYDFQKRQPRAKPEVMLVFRDLDGDEVLVPEGAEVPLEVKAAELAKKKKVKKVKKSIED